MKDKVSLDICGRKFDLDVEGLTELEIHALGQEITTKMNDLRDQYKIVDSSKLAILVALNYAEELSRLKKQMEDGGENKKIDEMILELQEVVK